MTFKTEFPFELPRGFIDEEGQLHRKGMMRLATAADEILIQRDDRVKNNPAYLSIILLSRVITSLGKLQDISTYTVENLFAKDFEYLQKFYQDINEGKMDGEVAPGE
jgi:phage FluMu protein gp41